MTRFYRHRTRLGFKRVVLEPGKSAQMSIDIDPRLLAHFDMSERQWRIVAGVHHLALGRNAEDASAVADLKLSARLFGK